MSTTTYSFQTSQPLTQQQIDYLNKCLENLPYQDKEDFSDIPEWNTLIEDPNKPPIHIFDTFEECLDHFEKLTIKG